MLHKYLKRRGNSYHFRWRIPADLRPVFNMTELTRSLHTLDLLLASVRAGCFVEAIAGIKRARWAYFAQEVDADVYALELERYWNRCSMARKEKTIETGLITFFHPDGTKFCDVDHKGDEKKEALASKELKDAGVLPEGVTSRVESKQVEDISGIMFSELYERFLAHKTDIVRAKKEKKTPLSERMQKEYLLYFNTLVAIMGDIPLSTITKKMLKDAILTCGMLPKRNQKPYKGVPVLELLEMDIPDKDRVRDKVPLDVKKMVQGMFKYAIDKGIVEASPARDMGLELDSTGTFAPYNKAEVRMMLAACIKESISWKKWLPTLAAYTGARRGELVQLRKRDVKLDSDSGRHYILITDAAGSVKSDNAIRQVPLHTALVEQGFLEFVDSVSDRVFEGLNPHSVTNWFTGFRDNLGIERCDDFGDRKVFHSFRHTFITQTRGAGNPTVNVQQVVGHEKTSAGSTDRYTGKMPVSVLLDVVDKISYE